MPDVDPVISSPQKVLKPGESMFLNCTSDYSLPPAEINWYIDDELQKVRINLMNVSFALTGRIWL